jgi:multiple antibiotic resistance protein
MDLLKPLIACWRSSTRSAWCPSSWHFTQNFSREQRQRTMRVSAFSGLLVIVVSALAG